MRVGFVGLGDQGQPIAKKIAEAGFTTTVWARRPEQCGPVVDAGAHVTGSLAELGAASDVVGVCVFGPDDVDEVLFGADGIAPAMRRGGVIVIHSTVSPRDIASVVERAAPLGIEIIDAPVSGGRAGVESGALLLMLGGAPGVIAECMPIFESFASQIHVAGAAGTAQSVKLLNNALLVAHMAVADEALRLATDLGVDARAYAAMAPLGTGGSFGLGIVMSAFGLDNLAGPGMQPLVKDVRALAAYLESRPDVEPTTFLAPAADRAISVISGHATTSMYSTR